MDWSKNQLSTILGRLQQCIGGISSVVWDNLTSDDVGIQNDLTLLSVDATICQMGLEDSESSIDVKHLYLLRDWVDATIDLAGSGRLSEVDHREGNRLFKSLQLGDTIEQKQIASLGYTSTARPRLKRIHHVSHSLRDASKSLFGALVHSAACCRCHIARVHLNGFDINDLEAPAPGFFFFLSSTIGSKQCYWQETSYEIHMPVIPLSTPHLEATLCSLLQECHMLGEPLKMTLYRAVDDTPRAIGKRVSAACRQDIPDRSLGELIDQDELINCGSGGKFPEASKATICLNLSLALIHLSASEWIPHSWNADNIFFSWNPHAVDGETWDTDQPYLSRPLWLESNTSGPGDESGTFFSPSKSHILSFAELVMEIYVGRRANQTHSQGERFQDLRELVTKDDVQRSVPKLVREAIGACIDFVSQREWDEQPDGDWLFAEIVLKLDDTVRMYAPPPSRPRLVGPSRKFKNQTQKPVLQQKYHESHPKKELKSLKASPFMDWFEMFEGVKEVLDGSFGDDNHPKTKIAILDTGLTADVAAEFRHPESKYRDFTANPKETMNDATGHGTSIFELVCRVCENADIFVARVWEESRATLTTVQSIIKALEWVMENDVDIICLAFGFLSEPPELREALVTVFAANILVFAAASNHNNRMGVAYPARWDDLVFCMFSTNSDGKNSSTINPAGLGNDDFAILGENIQLYSGKVDSGTSFATAIACGFAARLLDFSRQKEVVKTKFGKFGDRIKEKRILTEVFKDISKLSEGYRCIMPLSLLPENLQAQSEGFTDEQIRDARERICIRISRCAGLL